MGVVSALCALSTKPFLSREKGGWELGAMGKEGGEVPVCRRDPGLPGGIAVAAARPQRQLLHPISAFVGFAEVGVLGAAQLGSWCLEETGWLAGCSGKHLWALSADGRAGVDTAEPKLLCHSSRGSCCQGDG